MGHFILCQIFKLVYHVYNLTKTLDFHKLFLTIICREWCLTLLMQVFVLIDELYNEIHNKEYRIKNCFKIVPIKIVFYHKIKLGPISRI